MSYRFLRTLEHFQNLSSLVNDGLHESGLEDFDVLVCNRPQVDDPVEFHVQTVIAQAIDSCRLDRESAWIEVHHRDHLDRGCFHLFQGLDHLEPQGFDPEPVGLSVVDQEAGTEGAR